MTLHGSPSCHPPPVPPCASSREGVGLISAPVCLPPSRPLGHTITPQDACAEGGHWLSGKAAQACPEPSSPRARPPSKCRRAGR